MQKLRSKNLRKVYSVILVLVLGAARCFSSTESTYEALIDRLQAITGYSSADIAEPYIRQYSDGMAEKLAQLNPSLPPQAIEIVSDEIAMFLHEQMFINAEVKALQYDAYKQYFSQQEILDLITFYESPLGQKLLSDTPLMAQETIDLTEFYKSPLGQKLLSDAPFMIQYIEEGWGKAFDSITANLVENIGPRLNKRMRDNGW